MFVRAKAAARVVVLVLPGLVACTDADPALEVGRASQALGRGAVHEALERYESALGALPRTDPAWKRAKLGRVEALILLDREDFERALRQAKEGESPTAPRRGELAFLEFAGADPDAASSKEWRSVLGKLTQSALFDSAVAVLAKGLEVHAGDAELARCGDAIRDAAAKAGAKGALGALAGLGYVD
jgi:hypothetical protein